jgi:hypothetical protein
VAQAIAGGELYVFRQKKELMRDSPGRTQTQDLSREELEIIDEFILALIKIESLEDKLSVFDLAYILQLVLSEKDIKLLKEKL